MCHSTMTVCLNTSMLFYKVQEKKIKHQKPLIKLTLGLELPDTINCWKQAKVGLAARSCGGQRSNCGCALSGNRVGLFWRPAADSDSGSPSNTKRDSHCTTPWMLTSAVLPNGVGWKRLSFQKHN